MAIKNDTEKNEGEKLVKIKLPRIPGEDSVQYISINERSWMIKRGVEVEVPECVKEMLEQRERYSEMAYAYTEQLEQQLG